MISLLNKLRDGLAHWWSEFTLQTRLMAAATLVVSLLMSSLTFWAVNTIQEDARLHDTRFGRDLGLLMAADVSPMVAGQNRSELARFSYQFYQSSSSIRYVIYADGGGDIFFGIPFSELEVQNSLTIQRRIQLPEGFESAQEPLVRQHQTPDGEVTDVFVPLISGGRYLGVMALGINPNPTVVASSHLTRDVTVAVFVSIWVMVILGAVFNALTITRPIKELLVGVKNIAAKNFKQRINLPLGGELGELIVNFNEMAERLERYEEQNIEELTAEKAKLETLVSTIADGAILLDANLNVILANPTAKRILGWEGLNVAGSHILHNLPETIKAELIRPLHRITTALPPEDHGQGYGGEHSEGRSEAMEFRLTLFDTAGRTVRILLTRVLDQAREHLRGIAITVQDITREVELNEAKSQFISNVSHELRTPLFNIKSFIETLHDYGEDLSEAERLEFLDTANRETDRLTRLVNDVLDLSRLESNRLYRFEAVELLQPIEQTLRTYQLTAKDKQIQLLQDVDPHLPAVLGNYDLLLQVLTNLVGNALKFTNAGGSIAIRAHALAPDRVSSTYPCVRVEVADTGIGIDPEDQAAIFDRFFRVENRVHTLEGTGLGLSIVRNIVGKHHGTVNLISEPSVGTTFWFDLAVFQAEAPSFEALINAGPFTARSNALPAASPTDASPTDSLSEATELTPSATAVEA